MESQNPQILIALIAATVLFIVLAGFIVTFLFFYQKKQRLHVEDLKKQADLFKEEVYRAEREIREHTLENVAREIHDNIAQILLLAKLNLNRYLLTQQEASLSDTRDLIGEAIQDLRDLSKSLHPQQLLHTPLEQAIEKELIRIKKITFLDISLKSKGEAFDLDVERKLIVFRMIQEALQNVVKHANASRVEILLEYEKECLILNIQDNGCGFEPEDEIGSFDVERGSGLSNLAGRASSLNARLEIKSEKHRGTFIAIRIPH